MNNIGLQRSLILLFTVALGSSPARAEVRSGDKLTVAAEETVTDDLYVFAQAVVIDGTVEGDLIAFAETVTVNGTVTGDLLGAAQSIKINGQVGDDVRIAAQTITLSSSAIVDDDLVTAGLSLDCEPDSQIRGELKYAGYQARLAGTIERRVTAAVTNCQLDGKFGGDVQLEVAFNEYPPAMWSIEDPIEFVPPGLTITDSASIAGDLDYKSPAEGSIDPGAQIAGSVNHGVLPDGEEPPTLVDRARLGVKRFAAMLVVGLLVVFVFPRASDRTADVIQAKPLASFAWGLGGFVVAVMGIGLMLVATILVAVALGMISLQPLLPAWLSLGLLSTASVAVAFTVFVTWIAKALVGYCVGTRLLSNKTSGSQKLLALVVGCALVVGLSQLPWAGPIVGLLIAIVVTGACVVSWRDARRRQTETTPRIAVQQAA